MRGQLKYRHNLQTIPDAAQQQRDARRREGRVVGLGNAQRLSHYLVVAARMVVGDKEQTAEADAQPDTAEVQRQEVSW